MMQVLINGIQNRLPVIRLDGYDYFIQSGTYRRLTHEKIITEGYKLDGSINRSIKNTGKTRWEFTLLVPADAAQVVVRHGLLNVGDLDTLHATADKMPPNDLVTFYDISALEDFTGNPTHRVYVKIDWESPHSDDPGRWQVPVSLWGYEYA